MNYFKPFLFILTLALTACERFPVANMPDEPLDTPLEINTEPQRIAMTNDMTVAIKDNGELWEWGNGNPTPKPIDYTVKNLYSDVNDYQQIKGIDKVKGISASNSASVFLTEDGQVHILSKRDCKQYPKECNKYQICRITLFDNMSIIKVKGGAEYIFALNDKGEFFATNFRPANSKPSTREKKLFPLGKIELPKKVVDFDIGIGDFALLEDGTLWSWGTGSHGQTAQGTRKDILMPRRIKGLSKVVKFNSNSANTINGDLYTWGGYTYGGTFFESGDNIMRPVKIMSDIQVYQYPNGDTKQGKNRMSKKDTLTPIRSLFNMH